jgi:hypothetical protein
MRSLPNSRGRAYAVSQSRRQTLARIALVTICSGCGSILGDPFGDLKLREDAAIRDTRGPQSTEPDSGSTGSQPIQSDAGAGMADAEAPDAATPTEPPNVPPTQPREPAAQSGAAGGGMKEPEPADLDDAGSPYEPLDDCLPTFAVSNGIVYPPHSAGPRVFDVNSGISTNPGSPDCDPTDTKHCVVVAESIHIMKEVGVSGERPLVLLAAHNVTLDAILNVAGGDANQFQLNNGGPGDHAMGMSNTVSGGGGNATPGGGGFDGTGAGSSIPLSAGLIGGGHGSKDPDPLSLNCIAGGGGGGALQIVSLCGSIRINAYINARGGGGNGGAGFNPSCPDGNGGGAGGTVWLQANALSFGIQGTIIQLSGGGGGGGACWPANTTLPIAGTMGKGSPVSDADLSVAGADCGDGIAGGVGGVGGRRDVVSGRGGAPTPPGMPMSARGGGGGGSRGRLVLQNIPNQCFEVLSRTDGECVVAERVR